MLKSGGVGGVEGGGSSGVVGVRGRMKHVN